MIDTLKQLEKMIKLCRKQGVTKITFDNVALELGDLPVDTIQGVGSQEQTSGNPYAGFPTGTLTPEELTYYSVNGYQPDSEPKEEAS